MRLFPRCSRRPGRPAGSLGAGGGSSLVWASWPDWPSTSASSDPAVDPPSPPSDSRSGAAAYWTGGLSSPPSRSRREANDEGQRGKGLRPAQRETPGPGLTPAGGGERRRDGIVLDHDQVLHRRDRDRDRLGLQEVERSLRRPRPKASGFSALRRSVDPIRRSGAASSRHRASSTPRANRSVRSLAASPRQAQEPCSDGARDLAGLGDRGRVLRPGDAEVGEACPPRSVEQDVSRASRRGASRRRRGCGPERGADLPPPAPRRALRPRRGPGAIRPACTP